MFARDPDLDAKLRIEAEIDAGQFDPETDDWPDDVDQFEGDGESLEES